MKSSKSNLTNSRVNGLENPFDIDRSIFNKEDQRNEDLHLQLSEKYMVYKDLADRCIINPTQIGKFFWNSNRESRKGRPQSFLCPTRFYFHTGASFTELIQK